MDVHGSAEKMTAKIFATVLDIFKSKLLAFARTCMHAQCYYFCTTPVEWFVVLIVAPYSYVSRHVQ